MELVCPICGLDIERGRPDDIPPLTPIDRINYRHMRGDPLCPVLGLTSQGTPGYIPTLPIPKRG